MSRALISGTTLRGPLIAAALAALLALAAPGGAPGDGADAGGETVFIELRVWQHIEDAANIWISARPRGGRWDALGTIPFPLDGGSGSTAAPGLQRSRDLAIGGVGLRLSQRDGAHGLVFVRACSSACPVPRGEPDPSSAPGSTPLPLDDGHSTSGRYRYGDLILAVPAGNQALLDDRERLLALRGALAGEATLNWSAATATTDWEGVTVSGAPRRVTGLDLTKRGLTGSIPSELESLSSLSALFLGENELTGCLPVALLAVASNDLAALGLEETCAPPPTTNLPYNLHTTGAVTAPGSYAFLSDVGDLGSTLDRYVHDWYPGQDSFGFLVHQSDTRGVSRSALYDTVAAGDTFDWWRGDRCYTRFAVREVRPDPAGTSPRKLLVIAYLHDTRTACDELDVADAPQPVEFRWRPPPWAVGPDGIRATLDAPVTGPGTYRLSRYSPVVIRIPTGVAITVEGAGYSGGIYHVILRDEATGAELGLDWETGSETGRRIPDGVDASRANALFDQLLASVELTPGWGGSE